MSATVLSFLDRFNRPAPPRPWSEQELAEFYRVQASLNRAGLSVGYESGTSDEGDPWFVFFREDTGEVIAHFARINGGFLADSPVLGEAMQGNDLRQVIDRLARRQPLILPPGGGADGTLFLHPAVILTALVATALMQSMGLGEAQAASLDPETPEDAAAAKATEKAAADPLRPEGRASLPGLTPPPAASGLDALLGGHQAALLSAIAIAISLTRTSEAGATAAPTDPALGAALLPGSPPAAVSIPTAVAVTPVETVALRAETAPMPSPPAPDPVTSQIPSPSTALPDPVTSVAPDLSIPLEDITAEQMLLAETAARLGLLAEAPPAATPVAAAVTVALARLEAASDAPPMILFAEDADSLLQDFQGLLQRQGDAPPATEDAPPEAPVIDSGVQLPAEPPPVEWGETPPPTDAPPGAGPPGLPAGPAPVIAVADGDALVAAIDAFASERTHYNTALDDAQFLEQFMAGSRRIGQILAETDITRVVIFESDTNRSDIITFRGDLLMIDHALFKGVWDFADVGVTPLTLDLEGDGAVTLLGVLEAPALI